MKSYITSNKEILGGTPVVIGTRIPVQRIIFLFKEGYTLEEITLEYPQLTERVLGGVLEEISQNYGTQI